MSTGQAMSGPGSAAPGSVPESQLQPQQQQHSDPSMNKLTRGTSCVLCQQRKVRCDRNKPCANCVKVGAECKVVPPQPPRRRKRRTQERDLVERLKKYEALLKDNGIKFDAIGHDLKSNGHHDEDMDDLENDFDGLKTTPEAQMSPNDAPRYSRPGRSILSLHREFRVSEHMLHDSSDEEDEECTIHRAFDKMFTNNDGFPFVVSGRKFSTERYHPSPIHIFQLWQIYIDNINPLLKLTHVPSMQSQIIQASSNLGSIPKNVEALMFAIYSMSVTSMEDEEVEAMFNLSKKEVLAQFFEGLQQALLNAGFMRSQDVISLQAYVLYLFAIRWFVDPRQVFCLIGVAVRIAQRLGLHHDPAAYGLPPFEVELRRRLWWTIVSYDRRIGEMTGSTVTALSSGGNCKLPLNINDSDLHVDGREAPTPHTGQSEMLFAITRFEFAMAVVSDIHHDGPAVNSDKCSPSASSSQANSKQSPVANVKLAGQDSASYTFEGFRAHLENTYLQYCDPRIPLHFFTITMTRQTLAKLRVINLLLRMCYRRDPLTETEKEHVFLLSVQMIEYDNIVHSSESLRPFKWFTAHHFPFPAYMYLVQELRQQCYGPLVERAWEAIAKNHDLRHMINHLHSPMHAAFGRHFVKAWDAHTEACLSNGKEAPIPPTFVTILRERIDKKRKGKLENDPNGEADVAPFDIPRLQGNGNFSGTNVMMTPPSMGAPIGSSAASSIGIGDTPLQPTSDMDWSYLVSSFPPEMGFGAAGFQPLHSFGGIFGPGPGPGPMNADGRMANGMGGDRIY